MNTLANAFKSSVGLTSDEFSEVENIVFEDSMVDFVAAEQEYLSVESQSVELSDLATQLADFDDAVCASLESGEVSQESAKWILATGQHLYGKVGMSIEAASTESFGSPSDTVSAVEAISVENSGMFSKIIDAIKEFIKKIRASVKKMFIKMTDASKGLKKRAEALKKKAKDTNGKPEDKTFETSAYSKLHMDGKAATAKQLVDFSKAFESVIKDHGSNTKSEYKAGVEKIKSILGEISPSDEAYQEGSKVPVPARKSLVEFTRILRNVASGARGTVAPSGGLKGSLEKRFGDDKEYVVFVTEDMPGGKVVIGMGSTKDPSEDNMENMKKFISSADIRLVGKKDKYDIDDKGDMPVLERGEIESICDNVIKITDVIHSSNVNFKERDKAVDKIDKAIDKLDGKLRKNTDKISIDARRVIEAALEGARKVSDLAGKPMAPLGSYGMTFCRDVLSYGEQSIAQYSDKND